MKKIFIRLFLIITLITMYQFDIAIRGYTVYAASKTSQLTVKITNPDDTADLNVIINASYIAVNNSRVIINNSIVSVNSSNIVIDGSNVVIDGPNIFITDPKVTVNIKNDSVSIIGTTLRAEPPDTHDVKKEKPPPQENKTYSSPRAANNNAAMETDRTPPQEHRAYSVPQADNTNVAMKTDRTPVRNDKPYTTTRGDNNHVVMNHDLVPDQGYIDGKTYGGLIDELKNVGSDKYNSNAQKVRVSGEIRYHYSLNGSRWDNNSGIRAYLGFDGKINQDWKWHGMFEARQNILNYDNKFALERLYVLGNLGSSTLQAGAFSYLMAEGNIYDSRFIGVRAVLGEAVKYTLSYGDTYDSKNTFVATASHEDYDYDLEAGVYRYQLEDTNQNNTITTLSGNYHFDNFSLGAMYLGSSMKDANGNGYGYVLSFNHGLLKVWEPNTYRIFAKYYNQPLYTYIAHGMNGLGTRMSGFKGFGVGLEYVIAPNTMIGLEYYNLIDKISNVRGKTVWSHINRYF